MKVWNLIAAIWLKSQSEVLGYICACKASNTYQTNIFVCCAALSILFLFIYCCFVLIVTLEQLYVFNYNFDTNQMVLILECEYLLQLIINKIL